jgi:hypothetical protein
MQRSNAMRSENNTDSRETPQSYTDGPQEFLTPASFAHHTSNALSRFGRATNGARKSDGST